MVAAGFFLSIAGQIETAFDPLLSNQSLTATMADFFFLTYGIPVLLAISFTNDEDDLRVLFWLNGAQAIVAAVLIYLQIFSILPSTGHSTAISTTSLMYVYNAENLNRHVNHIPAIAQHFMLLEALKTGLTEERIAAALDVSLDSIRIRRDLLNGICPEVVQILIDKSISPQVFGILRKMKPVRQIEAAEHMVAGGTYTIPFAKALLAVTKPEMLEGHAAPSKKLQATSMAARSMLEEENDYLLRDLKSVEESYGTDVLTLTVTCGYLDRLLKNPKIERYLARNHVEILQTLKKLLTNHGLKAVPFSNGKNQQDRDDAFPSTPLFPSSIR